MSNVNQNVNPFAPNAAKAQKEAYEAERQRKYEEGAANKEKDGKFHGEPAKIDASKSKTYEAVIRFVPNLKHRDAKTGLPYRVHECKSVFLTNPIDSKDVVSFKDAPFLNRQEIPFFDMFSSIKYSNDIPKSFKDSLQKLVSVRDSKAALCFCIEDLNDAEQNGDRLMFVITGDTAKDIKNEDKVKGIDVFDFTLGKDLNFQCSHDGEFNKQKNVFERKSSPLSYKHNGKEFTFDEAQQQWVSAKFAEGLTIDEVVALADCPRLIKGVYNHPYADKIVKDFMPEEATDEIKDNLARMVALIFTNDKTTIENIMANSVDANYMRGLKYGTKPDAASKFSGKGAENDIRAVIEKNKDFTNRIIKFMNAQQPTQSYYQQAPQQQPASNQPVYNAAPSKAPVTTAFDNTAMPEDDLPF